MQKHEFSLLKVEKSIQNKVINRHYNEKNTKEFSKEKYSTVTSLFFYLHFDPLRILIIPIDSALCNSELRSGSVQQRFINHPAL